MFLRKNGKLKKGTELELEFVGTALFGNRVAPITHVYANLNGRFSQMLTKTNQGGFLFFPLLDEIFNPLELIL